MALRNIMRHPGDDVLKSNNQNTEKEGECSFDAPTRTIVDKY